MYHEHLTLCPCQAFIYFLHPQRPDDIVELRQREDGTHVVHKTYYTSAYDLYKCEVQAYTLLHDHGTLLLTTLSHSHMCTYVSCFVFMTTGITPVLLGLWCDKTTGDWVIELEYWPTTVYMPQSLAEVASIMKGLCKVLTPMWPSETSSVDYPDISPSKHRHWHACTGLGSFTRTSSWPTCSPPPRTRTVRHTGTEALHMAHDQALTPLAHRGGCEAD
jgi:hypothetical protein